MSSMCILLDHLDGEVGGPLEISGSSGNFKAVSYKEDGFPLKSGCLSITQWQFLPAEKQIEFID